MRRWTVSPASLPIALRSFALTGSLCVPSPCAMSAPSNGSPSIAPRIFTSPRVPNSSAASSITTQVHAPGLSPFWSRASNSLNMTPECSHRRAHRPRGRCGPPRHHHVAAWGYRRLAGMPPTDMRPAFVVPMKAVLTAERPAGPEWVFERKLDGIRCLAVKEGGRTRLYSRNELSLTERYAPLAAALDADLADGFVIDGEAVAFVGGRDRFGGEGGDLFYYVFDVLFAGGRDVRSLPLEERRQVLDGLLR